MIEGFLHLFQARSPFQVLIDLVDLLVVTYVIYRALLVLRGTRAMQMGTGLGVIFVVYVIAKWAGFITLVNLLSSLLSSIILVVVVVFQNDIRRLTHYIRHAFIRERKTWTPLNSAPRRPRSRIATRPIRRPR